MTEFENRRFKVRAPGAPTHEKGADLDDIFGSERCRKCGKRFKTIPECGHLVRADDGKLVYLDDLIG